MGRGLGNEEPPPPLPQPWAGWGLPGAEVLMAVPWERTSLGGRQPCLGTQAPTTGRSPAVPIGALDETQTDWGWAPTSLSPG